MIKQLRNILLNLVSGANIATVAAMLIVGYSDRLHPASHPTLSTIGMAFPAILIINIAFLVFWILIRWKRSWIAIAGLLLAYQPVRNYCPINLPQSIEGEDSLLKIITYNVCNYSGNDDYDEPFDTILGYLRKERPDIVCQQEDNGTERHQVFKRYSELFAYNDTMPLNPGHKAINNLGLHSRFPIIRREQIAVDDGANGAAAWFLKIGQDTVIIINCHLETTHLSKAERTQYQDIISGNVKGDTLRQESRYLAGKLGEASKKRALQAETVHQYVEAHKNHPILLCGDFNDTPISYSRHTIAKGLTDCYAAAGVGPGRSFNRPGFYFRIDHIFCSQHFTPVSTKTDSKIAASDHYPMVCWLKMQRNP